MTYLELEDVMSQFVILIGNRMKYFFIIFVVSVLTCIIGTTIQALNVYLSDHECSICFEDTQKEMIRLSRCNHEFCLACIVDWAKNNNKKCITICSKHQKSELILFPPVVSLQTKELFHHVQLSQLLDLQQLEHLRIKQRNLQDSQNYFF